MRGDGHPTQMPRGKGIYDDEGDSFDERDPTASSADDGGHEKTTDTPDVESAKQAGEPTG
ncbi:hypothetical protein [Mycobacterium sp. URHB0044]|uniref:hypothetical protein n=1 Tax=Mycobacterium sp. URHB0044 TaxID=1380386 RepID=UPI000A9B88ED|nr:hypothetical protein [Mycobacterium sp. URHB0044]